MYSIRMPSGNYLEGRFDLTFELNNQVFATSDATVLPGSFTFPAEAPLTEANKIELGHPHLVTNAAQWQDFEGVWVECFGVAMFYGTLSIRTATPKKVGFNIVANPIKRLKEIDLNDIDLGGERDFGAFSDWLDLMKDTVLHPEDHDFVFVPMFNEDRNSYVWDVGDPYRIERPYFNHYDITTEAFTENSGALVPFVKIEYLLEQIFAAENTGYAFSNAWQGASGVELLRLYLFNNWDMRTLNASGEPDLPTTINLANHVPKIKATDLLKKLMAQWALGLFTSPFNNSIRLVALQQLLQRPAARDWTQYVISENTLEDLDVAPGRYNYENQPEELPHGVPLPEDVEYTFNTLADFNAASPLPDGTYIYIETEMMVAKTLAAGSSGLENAWLQHRGVTLDPDGKLFETGMETLIHYSAAEEYNTPVIASRFYEQQDAAGSTIWERQVTEPPTAVFFYRGINDTGFANPYPVACNHVWLPYGTGGTRCDITVDTTPVAQAARSLNWFGDYGLFETAHKTWAYMLFEGKDVRLQLALPVAELVQFSFEDKIRILSMDYFVKRLKVGKPLGAGLVLVEASLISVI